MKFTTDLLGFSTDEIAEVIKLFKDYQDRGDMEDPHQWLVDEFGGRIEDKEENLKTTPAFNEGEWLRRAGQIQWKPIFYT